MRIFNVKLLLTKQMTVPDAFKSDFMMEDGTSALASSRSALACQSVMSSRDGLAARYKYLSELRRPKPEPRVLAFIAEKPLDLLYVSSVTFAEIRFCIELLPEASRRAELNDWLTHIVRPMFEQRVFAVSEDVMFKWRLLVEEGRKAGHTFSQPNLIIAATALQHGLTAVSRDTSDYKRARVNVVNPWRDAAR